MLNWLRSLAHPAPVEDVHVDLPAVELVYNHRTKTVFLMAGDPSTPDGAYDDLEKHLKKQNYFLQVLIPSASLPPRREGPE